MTTFVLLHGAYQGGWIWNPTAGASPRAPLFAVAADLHPGELLEHLDDG